MSQLGSSISAETGKSKEAQSESDGDPAASDVQVPDGPARPKMKENDAHDGRHRHSPQGATTKEDENYRNSAATNGTMLKYLRDRRYDAQVPDPLARPTIEENVTPDRSKRPQSPEEPVLQKGGKETKDKTAALGRQEGEEEEMEQRRGRRVRVTSVRGRRRGSEGRRQGGQEGRRRRQAPRGAGE